MKKLKKFLLIAFFVLAIVLFSNTFAKASTIVNTEDELIAFAKSDTNNECQLGEDITLKNNLEFSGNNKILDLNGHNLTASKQTNVEGIKLTINDSAENGKYTCTNGYGFYIFENGTVVINGGTFESLYAVLSGNNTAGNMNVEINGGILTAEIGATVYMPSQGNLKITGGTLNGGINTRMGQITITGGTINNKNSKNTDKIEEYYCGTGNIWYNSAVVFMTGTYTSDNKQYGNSLNLKISGGTFNSTIGNALTVYGLGKVKQDVNIDITGGTFKGKDADVVVDDLTKAEFVTKEEYKAVSNDNKLAISGGLFAHSVNDYLKEGYIQIQNETSTEYTVKENLVLECTDSETEIAKLESQIPLKNTYRLVVENKENNEDEKAELDSDAKDLISKLYDETKDKVNDMEVLLTCDISVKDGDQVVKIEGTDEYKIYLKIDEELAKKYNCFKVANLDDNGNIKELFDAELIDDNVAFTTTHLSPYSVIGYNTETVSEEKNDTTENDESPKTGDNVLSYIGILTIAVLGLTIVISQKKRMNK